MLNFYFLTIFKIIANLIINFFNLSQNSMASNLIYQEIINQAYFFTQ